MDLILCEKLLGIWTAIFQGVTGIGGMSATFAGGRGISMGSRGVKNLTNSSAYAVARTIGFEEESSGAGRLAT